MDENIDVRVKNLFVGTPHRFYTVREMHWNGLKNGELLQLIRQHGFDCWIVVDKNIPYQQNPAKLECAVLVLDVMRNTLPRIERMVNQITSALERVQKNQVIIIQEED